VIKIVRRIDNANMRTTCLPIVLECNCVPYDEIQYFKKNEKNGYSKRRES